MKQPLDFKRLLLLASACLALTQIGTLLKSSAWLVQSPAVAYAAKETADDTKSKFEKFIDRMDAYTQAMQQQQQAPIQQLLSSWVEEDQDGRWCCRANDYEDCWKHKLWRHCPAEPSP